MTQPAPDPAPPARPNPLGRTAWLVMFAGLLAAAAIVSVTALVEGYTGRNGMQDLPPALKNLLPAYAVGLAIGGVSYLWALLLAVRALRAGEDSRLPIFLFNFATLPSALYAAAHWMSLPKHVLYSPAMRHWFLPVLLPFIALTCIGGTFLLPRVRHIIERMRKNRAPWSLRAKRLWIAGLWIMWTLLLGLVLLPPALFIHCLVLPTEDRANTFILNRTPDTYRDAAESVLALFDNPRLQEARRNQLTAGLVSMGHQLLRAVDPDTKISLVALYGLRKRNPGATANIASRLLTALTATGAPITPYYAELQAVVGELGTHPQRREIFERAEKDPRFPMHWSFFSGLAWGAPDEHLIPLLRAHLQSSVYQHEKALEPLVAWLPDAEAEALLKQAVNSNDAAARDFALSGFYFIRNRNAKRSLLTNFFFYCIEHPDVAVRKKAWEEFRLTGNEPREEQIACLRRVLQFLDSTDSMARRAAAHCIIRSLRIDELTGLWEEFDPKINEADAAVDPTKPVETGGAPLPLSQQEREALDAIAQAARKWLAQPEQPK